MKRIIIKGFSYLFKHGPIGLLKKIRSKIQSERKKPQPYKRWIKMHLPTEKELEAQKNTVFDVTPKFCIVVPAYQTPADYLQDLVDSVKMQTYTNWELCVLDSTEQDVAGIQGDYIVLANPNDRLAPHALFECASAINNDNSIDVIYSDEDKISADGSRHHEPHFKPDMNMDLLCTVNYISHLFVVKKELLEQVGFYRPEYGCAKEYDFIFRCVENAKNIYHIPKILYHSRSLENSAECTFEAGAYVVKSHYDRAGIPVEIYRGECEGLYRTRFLRDHDPLISIIIPNKDHIDDLKRCIDAIETKSTYRNYEYIIVENNSTEEETFQFYKELENSNSKVQVVYWDGIFNYSAINNYGVQYANGEYLLLLNNDTEIINKDCIEELLGYCMRSDVGAVGARLYYEDDTIQHAGVVVGFGGIAGHCFVQQPKGVSGYQHRIVSAQDYSAVTAACMMVKKEAFERVKGFSEELAVAFNDIDFCMKLRQLGYSIVYNPYAQLYHYESKSRGLENTPEKIERFNREIETFAGKWPDILKNGDPFYNPNLTLDSQDFSMKRL